MVISWRAFACFECVAFVLFYRVSELLGRWLREECGALCFSTTSVIYLTTQGQRPRHESQGEAQPSLPAGGVASRLLRPCAHYYEDWRTKRPPRAFSSCAPHGEHAANADEGGGAALARLRGARARLPSADRDRDRQKSSGDAHSEKIDGEGAAQDEAQLTKHDAHVFAGGGYQRCSYA